MKLLLFVLILVFTNCAQLTSLNLKKHQFGLQPRKIIWIQVAGLSEEHMALLKFSEPGASSSSFENFLCFGKAWNYNLYQLRTDPYTGFQAQLTGKLNIKNTCEDYRQKPIWKYLENSSFKSGIFEISAGSEFSLSRSKLCEEGENYLGDSVLWKMEPKQKKMGRYFHVSDIQNYQPGETYYDRSCGKKGCFTSLSMNIEVVFERHIRNQSNYLFVVRDFSLFRSFQKKDMKAAKEALRELEKLVKFFSEQLENKQDTLLLVSSTSVQGIELPNAGKQWFNFEKNGKNILYKKPALLSPVFASGARAENFCGVYEEASLLKRLLSSPKQQGLEFVILNPFN